VKRDLVVVLMLVLWTIFVIMAPQFIGVSSEGALFIFCLSCLGVVAIVARWCIKELVRIYHDKEQ
jgi:uncharacterized membrane protein